MELIFKNKINEAKTIDDEYNKSFASIDRDTFNKIISLDPETNIEQNKIGYVAKQLLLPKYLAGDTEFLDLGSEVSRAAQTYIKNRGTYPQQLRNITNFPTVADFVEYVLLGDDSDFAKAFSSGGISTPTVAVAPKKSKMDEIYEKFYADKISREDFDKVIAIDPETDDRNIGTVAQMLLLPKYIAGETDFVNDSEQLTKYIEDWNDNKENLPTAKRDISNYSSVADFIETVKNKGGDSDLLTQLKKDSKIWREANYLGSSWKFDIFMPTTRLGNAAIAGKPNPYEENIYGNNEYGRWCTTTRSYWDSYRSGSREYFDFISRKNPASDARKHNFQAAVYPDGRISDLFTGEESRVQSSLDVLLAIDPTICDIIEKTQTSYLANNDQYVAAQQARIYSNKPFVYESQAQMTKLGEKVVKAIGTVCKEVIISDGVTIIPGTTFFGWQALESVQFPDSVKRIGAQAFKGCGLKLLTLPKFIEKIDTEAFAACSKLHGRTYLPASLKVLGERAFYGTDVTLTLSNQRTDKIQVYKTDYEWLGRHLASVNKANESLEEELIDENIPRDLAQAYKRASNKSASSTFRDNPNSNHIELAKERRSVNYKYSDATYEALTPEECARRLRENPHDVNKLRMLINDNVAEWEQRPANGKSSIYCVYPVYLTEEQMAGMGYPNRPQNEHSTKKCESINKLILLLPFADKLYWTDEYEHYITADTPAKNTTKLAKIKAINPDFNINIQGIETDEEGNTLYSTANTIRDKRDINRIPSNNLATITYLDTLNNNHVPDSEHRWIKNLHTKYFYNRSEENVSSRILDTGAHTQTTKNKQQAFQKFSLAQGALKALEKNKDLYDEEEYDELHKNLEYTLEASKTNYLKVIHPNYNIHAQIQKHYDDYRKVEKELKDLEAHQQDYDPDEYEARHKKLDSMLFSAKVQYNNARNNPDNEQTAANADIIFALNNRRVALRNKYATVGEYKNALFKANNTLVNTLNQRLDDYGISQESEELKSQLWETETQIEHYQDAISEYEKQIAKLQKEIAEAKEKLLAKNVDKETIENQLKDMDNATADSYDKAARSVVENQIIAEKAVKKAQEVLTNTIGMTFRNKAVKELDSNLANLLDIISDGDVAEVAEQ